MKRIVLFFLGLLVLLPGAFADEISLRSDGWCPYTCDPASERKGILIEVAEKIFNDAGHRVDYALLNWARAVKEVRSGQYHALADAYISDAPDFVFPSEPFLQSQMCFFVGEDDPWQYQGFDSLDGRKVSLVNNYSYGPLFDDYLSLPQTSDGPEFLRVSGIDFTEQRIRQMARGRVDTILEDSKVLPYQVKAHSYLERYPTLKGFKNAGCLQGQGLYIGFSPAKEKSDDYAELIAEGLKRMKTSGAFDEIVRRYQ